MVAEIAEADASEAWDSLTAEFDAWAAAGQVADLFWRDDDVVAPGPKLDRLLSVTAAAGAPLMLAVIPAGATDALGDVVAGTRHAHPVQHGWAHVNHAKGSGDKGAWELGLHRGEEPVMADLRRGRDRLTELFGDRFVAAIVPPWNRVDGRLFPALASAGWHGVSAFGPRTEAQPVTGFTVNNAHLDPIRWKEGARFAGTAKVMTQLVDHLHARRTGTADARESTGLLTHHIDLDEAGWAFVERLGVTVDKHSAARWVEPAELFEGS